MTDSPITTDLQRRLDLAIAQRNRANSEALLAGHCLRTAILTHDVAGRVTCRTALTAAVDRHERFSAEANAILDEVEAVEAAAVNAAIMREVA